MRRLLIALKARLFAAAAATLWLTVALFVAVPRELAGGHVAEAAQLFFHDLHFVFIFFLVFVDVVIGVVLLDDVLMKRAVSERVVFFMTVIAVNIAVITFAGLRYEGIPPEPLPWAAFVAASVWLMRLWSFSGAYVAIPIRAVTGSRDE